MADRIAILGGEPYREWIKRNGPAQRMYKAYAAKWLEGEPVELEHGVWVSNMYWDV